MLADVTTESVEALLLESELLVRLPAHRNIVDFIGVSVVVPDLCLVMELCACTLRDVIIAREAELRAAGGGGAGDGGRQPPGRGLAIDRTSAIAEDVARGMVHLHTHGVVHRDLKCENVLLDASGVAKVCDFGVSSLSTLKSAAGNLRRQARFGASVLAHAQGATRWATQSRFNSSRNFASIDSTSDGQFARNRSASHTPYVTPTRAGRDDSARASRAEEGVEGGRAVAAPPLIAREEGVGTITHMAPGASQPRMKI